MALPGAKYEESPKKALRPTSVDGAREGSGMKRAISIKNNMQIPQVISSPKMNGLAGREIKYALQRRPSSERIILPYVQKK